MAALAINDTADGRRTLALTGRPTAALIPGARLAVYENAPHGIPLTHGERLNGDLLAFVRAG